MLNAEQKAKVDNLENRLIAQFLETIETILQDCTDTAVMSELISRVRNNPAFLTIADKIIEILEKRLGIVSELQEPSPEEEKEMNRQMDKDMQRLHRHHHDPPGS
jgi:hypothetical protein